jgi:tetratricopeptide (TPR) repeat protein
VQRARFEYATHQFERALGSYEALLASPEISPTDLDLLGHLDDYLELCIRVRGDLERSARALEAFARREDLTPILRGEVRIWIDSLRALERREPAPGALQEAHALLREARDPRRFRDARDALVYYLQASGVLHRFAVAPTQARADLAEAYYLLGAIETQVGKSFWLSQAEAFLEAAIRTAPRQPAAQRAYELLEEFLMAGYTGSDGTHVPADISARLDALRVLAFGEPAA